MLNIRKYFDMIFDTKEISNKEMCVISSSHLESLNVNNVNNRYDSMIADTQPKHNALASAISSEDLTIALRIGSTLTVDHIIDDFQKSASQQEGTIRGVFTKNSPIYKEFYPHGVSEYHEATKTNIEILMDRMINASTNHAASLPAGFASIYSNYKTQYTNARHLQLEKKEIVKSDLKDIADKRLALNIQIQKNMLLIAAENIGYPEVAAVYIDESLLPKSHRKETEETPQPEAPVIETPVKENTEV